MKATKIGLIREGKTPPDKRVPFSPKQVEEMLQRFPDLSVVSQQSAARCFKDEEWKWVDQEKNEEKNDQIQKLQAASRCRKLL